MKKIWVNKANSFKAADKFDRNYYSEMSPTERLETMQFLRGIDYKIKGRKHAGRKKLQKVIKIIQLDKE